MLEERNESQADSGAGAVGGANNPSLKDVAGFSYDKYIEWMSEHKAALMVELSNKYPDALNSMLTAGMDYAETGNLWFVLMILASLGEPETDSAYWIAGEIRESFPDRGPWDLKPHLEEQFDLAGTDMIYGVRADMFGNLSYGIMMAEFGVSEDVAIRGSHPGESNSSGVNAGISDSADDAAIRLGYQLVYRNADGISRDEYLRILVENKHLLPIS